MEFRDVVRHRRMVRRFDQRPVPRESIDRIIDLGRRAPSAGFSQGLELLVFDAGNRGRVLAAHPRSEVRLGP